MFRDYDTAYIYMKSLFSISYQLVGIFPYSEKLLSIFCSFLPDLIKHRCTLLMYIHVFLILLGGKVIFLLVSPIFYFLFFLCTSGPNWPTSLSVLSFSCFYFGELTSCCWAHTCILDRNMAHTQQFPVKFLVYTFPAAVHLIHYA